MIDKNMLDEVIQKKKMLKTRAAKDRWELNKKIAELFPSGLRMLYRRTATQKKPSLLEVQFVESSHMVLCRYINTKARATIRLSVEKIIAKAKVFC